MAEANIRLGLNMTPPSLASSFPASRGLISLKADGNRTSAVEHQCSKNPHTRTKLIKNLQAKNLAFNAPLFKNLLGIIIETGSYLESQKK